METDTEGGRMVHDGQTALNDRGKGTVHVAYLVPEKDPHYAVSWSELVKDAGLDVILVKLEDVMGWMAFLMSSTGLYKKPDKADCYKGLQAGEWFMSNAKHINIGSGEDKDGKVVLHHGVLFCKNNIFQTEPDMVTMRRNFRCGFDEKQIEVESSEDYGPKQLRMSPTPLMKAKVADLCDLGKLIGC